MISCGAKPGTRRYAVQQYINKRNANWVLTLIATTSAATCILAPRPDRSGVECRVPQAVRQALRSLRPRLAEGAFRALLAACALVAGEAPEITGILRCEYTVGWRGS